MSPSLSGRIALITGAERGIGAALSVGLARAGAKIVLTGLNLKQIQEAASRLQSQGHTAWAYQLDVTDLTACETLSSKIAREVGNISILINNAGVQLRGGSLEDAETPRKWRAHFSVNVDGMFNVVRAFVPSLKKTKGCVVNIASTQAFVANIVSPGYAPSKGAVLQFTRTLAAQLAPDGVRVNAIAPGLTISDMTQPSLNNPEHMQRYLSHVPMGRSGQPEEMVGPVVFLASDAASYVTGATLPVDGGYLIV